MRDCNGTERNEVLNAKSDWSSNFATVRIWHVVGPAAQGSGDPLPQDERGDYFKGTDVMINGTGGVFGEAVVLLTSTT